MSKKFDLIVVGTGNAALCSAIAAREKGAEVLVVERGPKEKRGGNSFFTDGAIRFAYKNLEALKDILPAMSEEELERIEMPDYSKDDYYEDIMRVTQGKSTPHLARQLADQSFETIQWMKEQGVAFELNENQSFDQNGKRKFWGGLPVKTHRKGIGLIEALIERAESLGITFKYDTRAIKLETINNKISGLIVIENGERKKFQPKQ